MARALPTTQLPRKSQARASARKRAILARVCLQGLTACRSTCRASQRPKNELRPSGTLCAAMSPAVQYRRARFGVVRAVFAPLAADSRLGKSPRRRFAGGRPSPGQSLCFRLVVVLCFAVATSHLFLSCDFSAGPGGRVRAVPWPRAPLATVGLDAHSPSTSLLV